MSKSEFGPQQFSCWFPFKPTSNILPLQQLKLKVGTLKTTRVIHSATISEDVAVGQKYVDPKMGTLINGSLWPHGFNFGPLPSKK